MNAQQLKNSILQEAIQGQAPNGWEWSRLSGIALDSADGPFGSN